MTGVDRLAMFQPIVFVLDASNVRPGRSTSASVLAHSTALNSFWNNKCSKTFLGGEGGKKLGNNILSSFVDPVLPSGTSHSFLSCLVPFIGCLVRVLVVLVG